MAQKRSQKPAKLNQQSSLPLLLRIRQANLKCINMFMTLVKKPMEMRKQRELLGGKGANLAEMAKIGLPVPPGFTISTEVCTYFYKNNKKYPKV